MNIRKRLMAWHTAVLAVLLLAFTSGLYLALRYHLLTEVDGSLIAWADQIARSPRGADKLLGEGQAGMRPHLMAISGAPESFALLLGPGTQRNGGRARTDRFQSELVSKLSGLAVQDPMLTTVDLAGQSYRVRLRTLAPDGGADAPLLAVGRSLVHVRTTMRDLILPLSLAWLVAVVVCAFISWLFVGRTLKPVQRMTRDALDIAASGALECRLDEHGEADEFGELSRALNFMLTSLETSYLAQRRFLADVSHQLRTPLTSVKANLGFLIRARDAAPDQHEAAFGDIVTEVDRMALLVNELLALARAEAVNPIGHAEEVDLAEVARQAADSLSPDRIRSRIDGPVRVRGDGEKLRQLIVILLDNALKYSEPGSEVGLGLSRGNGTAVLVVTDSGPGIPPEQLPLVFERFFRAASGKDVPGSGLGLAIAQSIVKSHGGRIELRNLDPGLAAEVELPEASGGTNA